MATFEERDLARSKAKTSTFEERDRARSDYSTEKAKAKTRDAVRPTGALAAVTDAIEPLPVGDEVRGGLAAIGNSAVNLGRRVLGEPTVDSGAVYRANRDAENERRTAHPNAAVVGGLMGGLALAPAAAAARATAAPGLMSTVERAGRFLKTSAKAGVGGGLFSSLYGLADGVGGERIENAKRNFLPGVAGGVALQGAASAAAPLVARAPGVVRDVARALTTRPPAPGVARAASPRQAEIAAQAVERLAARRGLTPAAVRAAADTTYQGKPVTAAELLGREGQAQLAATARRGGVTADELEAQLRVRQQNAPHRIMQDFENDLGVSPQAARGDIEHMVEQGRARAAPLFETALGSPDPVWNDDLAALTERPVVRRALSSVAHDIRNAGGDPTASGFVVRGELPSGLPDVETIRQPTAETWDLVRKATGRQVERNPLTGAPLPDAQSQGNYGVRIATQDLTRALAGDAAAPGAIPGYREALDASGDYLQVNSAFERARGSLTRGSVGDFGRLWQSARTPAERSAMQAGVAADVMDLANAGHLRGGKFAVPGIQAKLDLAFGPRGASSFLVKMEAEAALARQGGRMMPGNGSPTYELAEAGGGGLGDFASAGAKLATGKPISAALDAVGTGLMKALAYARTSGMPVEVRDEYGRLLRMSADELEDFLARRQPRPVNSPRGGFVIPAELGGQAGQSSQ